MFHPCQVQLEETQNRSEYFPKERRQPASVNSFRKGFIRRKPDMAKSTNINVNLLLVKYHEMQERYGRLYNIPYLPKRNFLGTIEDNAGEL